MSDAETVKRREAEGKDARAHTPRSSHAEWKAPKDREDPVAILKDRPRVAWPSSCRSATGACSSPLHLLPWRGGDHGGRPRADPRLRIRAQLCGDAHLSNFGVFASPEREMLFDINDFDETLPGPWEWDVKRLAVSLCVAGRDRNLTKQEVADILVVDRAGL